MIKNSGNSITVKTFTWNKDSNDLFDYECSEINKDTINVLSSGYLTRQKDEIKFVEDVFEISNLGKILIHIEVSNTQFYANLNFENKNNSEMAWLSLRYLKSKSKVNGYFISQGDVIKLGRIKFKVRDIKLERKLSTDYSNNRKDNIVESNVNLNSFYKKELTIENAKKSKKVCRICYCDDKEVESPLLNPCNCLGGVKYIHFSCLQQWLKSRCIMRSSTNETCVTYTIKQMECELCKHILPDIVKYNGKVYEIWNFIKPEFKNYICLEGLVSDRTTDKQLHLISFDKKNIIRIGRSHETDLRITDISVSRFHANLTKTPENLIQFEDCNSKFGTLVMLQNPKVPIRIENQLPLQIGRSVLLLNMKEPWKLFSCFSCGADSPKRETDYSSINKGYIELDKILSVKIQNENDLLDEDENSISLIKASKTILEGQDLLENLSQNQILTNNDRDEDDKNSEMKILNGTHLNDKMKGMNRINSLNNFDKNIEREFDRRETNINVIAQDNRNNIATQIYNIANKKVEENTLNKEANYNCNNNNNNNILNLKQEKNSSQQSLIKKPSFSPVKINLNNFKKYEEDILTENNQFKISDQNNKNKKLSANNINQIEYNNIISGEDNKIINNFRSLPSERSSVKETNRIIVFQPKK